MLSTIFTDPVQGFLVGLLFGAALFLAGLADPDKIVGALRLKDLHAFRVIIVFLLVGMLGTLLLEMVGWAHFSVKPAAIASVLLGGALLGLGFGLTGYCPGTGLACAASGRLDAVVAVIGMLLGAGAYIALYPTVAAPLEAVANYGAKMLPDVTSIERWKWVAASFVVGALVLLLARERPPRKPKAPARAKDDQVLMYGAGI